MVLESNLLRSRRKYLRQGTQHSGLGLGVNVPQVLDQPGFVHRAQLIQDHLTFLVFELAGDTAWVRLAFGRHRRDDHSCDVAVHLVRGYDKTRPRLPNFATHGRIKSNQIHIEAFYDHCHSSGSTGSGWRFGVKKPVIAGRRHFGKLFIPSCADMMDRADDELILFDCQLDFFDWLQAIQKEFGDADTRELPMLTIRVVITAVIGGTSSVTM